MKQAPASYLLLDNVCKKSRNAKCDHVRPSPKQSYQAAVRDTQKLPEPVQSEAWFSSRKVRRCTWQAVLFLTKTCHGALHCKRPLKGQCAPFFARLERLRFCSKSQSHSKQSPNKNRKRKTAQHAKNETRSKAGTSCLPP